MPSKKAIREPLYILGENMGKQYGGKKKIYKNRKKKEDQLSACHEITEWESLKQIEGNLFQNS